MDHSAQRIVEVGSADTDPLMVRSIEEVEKVLDLRDACGGALDADPVVATSKHDIEQAFGFDQVTRVICV